MFRREARSRCTSSAHSNIVWNTPACGVLAATAIGVYVSIITCHIFLAHSTTESCIDGLNSVEKVSSQRKNARSCAADTTCVICVTYNARVVRTEFQIANNRKKTWYRMFPSWVACVSKCAVAVAIRLNECRTEPGGQRLHAEVSRLRISWYLHVLYSNMESSIIF